MRSKLKIKQVLYTYQNEKFLKIQFSCQHEYYKGRVCKDLVFELSADSKKVLRKNNILYKENGQSLFIGQKKEGDSNKVLPKAALCPIFIQVRVINSRFWFVTDFSTFGKNYIPSKAKSPLIMHCEKGELVYKDVAKFSFQALNEQYDFLTNLSKDIFSILLVDLKELLTKTQDIFIKLKAPSFKLRYTVNLLKSKKTKLSSSKKLKIEDVLSERKELVECVTESANVLRLKVVQNGNGYILESKKTWSMRERNPHKNASFFKFEVDVEDGKKAKEGKAEVFLPFPNRINSALFKKKKKDKVIVVEQDVKLLRFGAKPSPRK